VLVQLVLLLGCGLGNQGSSLLVAEGVPVVAYAHDASCNLRNLLRKIVETLAVHCQLATCSSAELAA